MVNSIKNLAKPWVLAVAIALMLMQVDGAFSLYSQPVNTTKTIVVPDNYSTINAAIGNATQGDTIFVKNGEYFENPVVNKSLTLVAEISGGAVVTGAGGVARGAKSVFTLAANGITLSGFTIKSLNYPSSTNYATGIDIQGDNCIVSHNNIVGTYY